jgi:hypothetical protein
MFISDPDRIWIRPKVSDPYGSGSGSATLDLEQDLDPLFRVYESASGSRGPVNYGSTGSGSGTLPVPGTRTMRIFLTFLVLVHLRYTHACLKLPWYGINRYRVGTVWYWYRYVPYLSCNFSF